MLTTGKAKQQLWPSLSPRQTEPKPRLINVTGSSVPSSASRLRRASDSEPEPEDYVPAPAFNQSFSDAIALALEKSIIKDNGDEGKHLITNNNCSLYLKYDFSTILLIFPKC